MTIREEMFLYYCCVIDVSINSTQNIDNGIDLEPAITNSEIYKDFADSASEFITVAEKLVSAGYLNKKLETNSTDVEYFLTEKARQHKRYKMALGVQ